MSIEDRIAGRKNAEALLELIPEGNEDFHQGMAIQLRKYANSVLGEPATELRTMDDQESLVFENRKSIRFGKYAGRSFKDVPINYLTFIADSSNELAAYLRSERGRKRIETEVQRAEDA